MKNNELTEVKSSIPSLEGLPQEVIEYVHGLVAENAALKNYLEPIGLSIEGTPATDTAIVEINRPIFEAMAELAGSMLNDAINVKGKEAKAFTICADRTAKLSANLRAGRKG